MLFMSVGLIVDVRGGCACWWMFMNDTQTCHGESDSRPPFPLQAFHIQGQNLSPFKRVCHDSHSHVFIGVGVAISGWEFT